MHVRVIPIRALAAAVVALAVTACQTKAAKRKPADLGTCSQEAAATYGDCVHAETAKTAARCADKPRVMVVEGKQRTCADHERYHRDPNHIGWELECERQELRTLRTCAGSTLAIVSKGGSPEQCADAGIAVYEACVAEHRKAADAERRRFDDRRTGRLGWEGECQRQKGEVRSACMDGGTLTRAHLGLISSSPGSP